MTLAFDHDREPGVGGAGDQERRRRPQGGRSARMGGCLPAVVVSLRHPHILGADG